MKAIEQYLKQRDFGVVSSSFYDKIALWGKWYSGRVPAFHDYRQYNGKRKISRSRKSLGMAKTIAEDWANLALNEKVGISTGKEADGPAIIPPKVAGAPPDSPGASRIPPVSQPMKPLKNFLKM